LSTATNSADVRPYTVSSRGPSAVCRSRPRRCRRTAGR
jgi:hypothetical protein